MIEDTLKDSPAEPEKRDWQLDTFGEIASMLAPLSEDEQERILRALVVFFDVDA